MKNKLYITRRPDKRTRTKLKEMGVNDSDYPFSKRIVVEKVIRLTDGRLKQISYKYNA